MYILSNIYYLSLILTLCTGIQNFGNDCHTLVMKCKKPKKVGAIVELRRSKGTKKMNSEVEVGSLAVKLSREGESNGKVVKL